MAADVKFCLKDSTTSGQPGGYLTLTSTLRFKAADNNTGASTDDPLVRPSSGTYYSYQKNLRCRVVTVPAVALLGLRVKMSVASISGVTGLALAYQFRLSSSGAANVNTVLPARVGVLSDVDVSWTNGGSPSGTAVGNHVVPPRVDGDFWNDTASDQLLLQMEVASGGSGGSISPFNLIISYNEI